MVVGCNITTVGDFRFSSIGWSESASVLPSDVVAEGRRRCQGWYFLWSLSLFSAVGTRNAVVAGCCWWLVHILYKNPETLVNIIHYCPCLKRHHHCTQQRALSTVVCSLRVAKGIDRLNKLCTGFLSDCQLVHSTSCRRTFPRRSRDHRMHALMFIRPDSNGM